MIISQAKKEDAKALLEIYAPYVTDTAVSFELTPPDEEEFAQRIEDISRSFPYLKAEEDGKIVGYAYAHTFRERHAYDHCVETTIYVREDCRRHGTGRALYEELEKHLAKMGIVNLYACIAVPGGDDPYLTGDSLEFHKKMGYELVGRFDNCAVKFGRWYAMVFMVKAVNEHTANPQDVNFGGY